MDKARNNLVILIVLYNKDLTNSQTLNSVLKWNNEKKDIISQLIIWDNSPRMLPKEQRNFIESNMPKTKISFLGDGNNYALSSIYNSVIRQLNNEDGWLMLLDHDTTVNDSIVDSMKSAVCEQNCPNLLLPKIYYSNNLVSPGKQFYFLGRHLKRISSGFHKSKHMTAINSGMIINIQYLKDKFPGYNEDIKFYGTDNDFMWKYAQNNELLYVLDERINHILNFYDDIDYEDVIKRLKDIGNGMVKQMMSINPILVPFAKLYFGYLTLKTKLSFRYNNGRK